jgi:hypothetical protein
LEGVAKSSSGSRDSNNIFNIVLIL